jgi:heme oxygenase
MHSESRRLLLRQATADAHQSVENAAGSIATALDYRQYVAGLYAFRAPIEKALEGCEWPQAIGAWRPIAISQPLKSDLADIDSASPAMADPDTRPPMSNDISDLLGLLYVLEGSSLGARIIYQRARKLGFHESYGARHLSAQTQSSQNWKDFIALLDHAPDFDLNRAARAANKAFQEAEDAFKRAGHVSA